MFASESTPHTLGAPTRQGRAAGRIVKRALDVLAAAIGLVLTAPLMLATAAAVRLEDRGPVLYRQTRVGLRGRTFELLKFRSMHVNDLPVHAVGQVGQGHSLVTRTGGVMRRLKLDELPQLWNVLRGDMSLVGPRPTVPEQVASYDLFQRRRLDVLPGMTGWAQINGNVILSWDERIALDVWYVDHWSIVLDLRVLLRTIGVVLRGERPDPTNIATAMAHANRPDRIS